MSRPMDRIPPMHVTRRFSALLLAALSFGLAASPLTAAQSAVRAVQIGDTVAGVGTVNKVVEAIVNDSGEWLVHAGTDNEDATIDGVLIRNGFLTLQEGTTVGNPSGARIDVFRSLNLDSRGDAGWELRLLNALPAIYGLYYNTRLIVLDGDPAPAPFSAGATYFSFNKIARYNDNWQMLVLCLVAEPSVPGANEDALIVFSTDGNGTLTDEKVLAYEGATLNGQSNTVRQITGNRNSFAINDAGQAMYLVRMNGPTSSDYAIYLDEEIVAQENMNSPQAGRRFESLNGARVDLNDRGDIVYTANLTGNTSSDSVIFKNDSIFVREGGPAVPGVIQSFGSGTPVQVTDAGDVVYYANSTGATASDESIYFNRTPIVREGVTPVGSDIVVTVKNSAESFNVSPNGRYLMFIGTTEDPIGGDLIEGAFVVDIGGTEILDGCYGNQPTLRRTDGFPVQGTTMTLSLNNAQAQGALSFLMASDRLVPGAPPCGLQIPSGELLIDFGQNGNPIAGFLGTSWIGSPVEIQVPIPTGPGLTDLSLYLQGIFFDSVGNSSQPLALTNALRIEIGAP